MPLRHNPFFRLIAFAAAVAALLYMPTREFLKLTFIMGIPFILLLGFNRRQQPWGVKWCLSVLLLLAVIGTYGYLLTDLPERIEVRRIVSEGGALVSEGHFDQAISEYRKLGDLGREKQMEEKIALAEEEKNAALSLQKGRQLLSQGKKEEALQVLESIPENTRAGREAVKLIAAINKGES